MGRISEKALKLGKRYYQADKNLKSFSDELYNLSISDKAVTMTSTAEGAEALRGIKDGIDTAIKANSKNSLQRMGLWDHPVIKQLSKRAELMDDVRNAKYLAKHKYFILSPAKQLGIPFRQALKHDMYKLHPEEWEPYSEYWFGKGGVTGANDPRIKKNFTHASSHHKTHSPHHAKKNSEFRHKIEAVADWYASARAQAKHPYGDFPSFPDWYAQNRQHFMQSKSGVVDNELDSYVRTKLKLNQELK